MMMLADITFKELPEKELHASELTNYKQDKITGLYVSF